MRPWKLAVPAIFACACTTTIEGPPLDDGIASGGTTSDTPSTGGAGSPGGSTAAGGFGGATSMPASGGTSSSGTSAGGTGAGGAGLGGGGPGGAGSGGTTVGPGNGGAAVGGSGAGVAGAGPTGGISGGGAGGATGATFAQVSDIIVRVCATSMCHGGRENPNLTAPNLYTTLTGTSVRQCGNDRLVTARDAANSALIEVVKGQCGNLVMPEGCDVLPCLDTGELATITDWIAAGAPR